jgi:hypothetical protein
MKKSLYLSLAGIFVTPYLAYSAIQAIEPCDPDFVYVRQPSLFAAKWQKVAYSDNFSEYINPVKIEKNLDSTVEVVTMRNYYKTQSDNDDDKNIVYKSHVSYETVDCFNQTVTVNKMYLLSDHYAKGSLIDEPIEPVSTPIRVNARSIGFSKIRKVCELSNLLTDPQFVKSSFMNNI